MIRTDEGGYSYKRTVELYKEYKEKCTEDNFLYIKLLQYLLTYFIALKVEVTKWFHLESQLKWID